MEVLLQAGVDANVGSPGGRSALSMAAAAGDSRSVRALLRSGASVNRPSEEEGETPLMLALRNPHVNANDLVRELLDAGAEVNARNRKGETALMIAQRGLSPHAAAGVTGLLLEAGADVHAKDAQGRTALDYAGGRSYNLIAAAGRK